MLFEKQKKFNFTNIHMQRCKFPCKHAFLIVGPDVKSYKPIQYIEVKMQYTISLKP